MYIRVLIPLDGSSLAESVLPYARALAAAIEPRVELLSVVESVDFGGQVRSNDPVTEVALQKSKQYLQDIAQSFAGTSVSCAVEQGEAGEIIIDRAARDNGTLIAMASRGRSGIHRWLMGSVAEKVLRGAANPLLLVRGNDTKSAGKASLTSIIVPLDGSEVAETVLPPVIELAKRLSVEIVLTRAYQIPVSAAYAGADAPYIPNHDALMNAVRKEAGAYLDAKVHELRGNGVKKVSSILMVGAGADEIIDLASSTPNNLIAMCTHGRSGVKRWVLGSVTEKVVRHSGDPVLIVRAR